jgi:hypothetical protein
MSLSGQVFEKHSVAGAESPHRSVADTDLHLTPRHENSVLTARSIVEIVEITVGRTAEGKIGGCLSYRPLDAGWQQVQVFKVGLTIIAGVNPYKTHRDSSLFYPSSG